MPRQSIDRELDPALPGYVELDLNLSTRDLYIIGAGKPVDAAPRAVGYNPSRSGEMDE